MELVRQNQRRLQVPRFAIHLQLPLYLRLMLRLLLGVMVIAVSAKALTRLMQPPRNPFAAYDDLIAGDTQDPAFGSNYQLLSSAAFDLACATSPIQKYCIYQPASGPFAEIRFMDLNDEGEIGVYFAVRDNALTVGEVALLWGRPTIDRRGNSLVLHWYHQGMSTVVRSDNGLFNYSLPVPYFLIRGLAD